MTLLVPLLTAIADRVFLSADLPNFIWPTLLLSFIGTFLVCYENNIDEDTESDMLTGITYQFISILFQVFSRLYMKISEGILAKHEVNLAGSFFTFFSTFLVTISIDASFQEWTVFENMSIMTWLIYGFISIMVFVVAYTSTVGLIRQMGPSLYSSVSGLRVCSTAFVGSFILNEGIKTTMEWSGVILVIASVTWFLCKLHGLKNQKKNNEVETEYLEEKPHSIHGEYYTPAQVGHVDSLSQIFDLMHNDKENSKESDEEEKEPNILLFDTLRQRKLAIIPENGTNRETLSDDKQSQPADACINDLSSLPEALKKQLAKLE